MLCSFCVCTVFNKLNIFKYLNILHTVADGMIIIKACRPKKVFYIMSKHAVTRSERVRLRGSQKATGGESAVCPAF